MPRVGQHSWKWGDPFRGPRGGRRCRLTCSNCGHSTDTSEVAKCPPGPCPWLPTGYAERQRTLAQEQWRRRSGRAARTEDLHIVFDPGNPAEAAALLMERAAELMARVAALKKSG